MARFQMGILVTVPSHVVRLGRTHPNHPARSESVGHRPSPQNPSLLGERPTLHSLLEAPGRERRERESIWNLAKPDIGVFPDIGSPTDTISGHMSRYRGFLLTRYRDMSHVTRYRVPISGTYPISGHHVTDIVNHIPDIGINIGYNIRCPDIGDMIIVSISGTNIGCPDIGV